MGRVWVVGSLNVDRSWSGARHPRVGETITGAARGRAPGGKGLNQAVAARRMGADVTLVGQVGDDPDGRWLSAVAADHGIDVDPLLATPDLPTGAALIVVAADGANTVTVDPGANATLAVDRLDLGPDDVVVAQLEVPIAAVRSALRIAREAGARSVLNPSPIGPGTTLVGEADVVVVNQAEAAHLTGAEQEATGADDALAQARSIAAPDQTVVVTLGGEGAVAAGPAGDVTVAGVPVTAVDTTGAGDCFLGVLAAGLVEGSDLGPALDRANRAAALAVTRHGTVDAMPARADLDRAS